MLASLICTCMLIKLLWLNFSSKVSLAVLQSMTESLVFSITCICLYIINQWTHNNNKGRKIDMQLYLSSELYYDSATNNSYICTYKRGVSHMHRLTHAHMHVRTYVCMCILTTYMLYSSISESSDHNINNKNNNTCVSTESNHIIIR